MIFLAYRPCPNGRDRKCDFTTWQTREQTISLDTVVDAELAHAACEQKSNVPDWDRPSVEPERLAGLSRKSPESYICSCIKHKQYIQPATPKIRHVIQLQCFDISASRRRPAGIHLDVDMILFRSNPKPWTMVCLCHWASLSARATCHDSRLGV